jgi:hypothetical protein
MTTDYQTQIEELRDQAYVLPEGPSKLAFLEEAVRLADVHQDVALADDVRKELINAATFSGYPEKALVAFSWRLAQCDRDPDKFPEQQILWEYKWIADSLTDFPQISRQQIDDAFDDMARRCERSGAGLRAVHKLRWQSALNRCEPDTAREYYRKWEQTPRDWNTDCAACEQDDFVEYHLFLGEKEKALELAEPILDGTLRCATIPQNTYGRVLLPLVQLGQVDKAAIYHRRGYRLICNNRKFLSAISNHLRFFALTDNFAQALRLLEKHLEWALEAKDLLTQWRFLLAARFCLRRLAENGHTSLKLRLSKAAACFREEGTYEVAVVASWLDELCRELAARFDARNGNDGFAHLLAAQDELKQWVTPYPLGRSS